MGSGGASQLPPVHPNSLVVRDRDHITQQINLKWHGAGGNQFKKRSVAALCGDQPSKQCSFTEVASLSLQSGGSHSDTIPCYGCGGVNAAADQAVTYYWALPINKPPTVTPGGSFMSFSNHLPSRANSTVSSNRPMKKDQAHVNSTTTITSSCYTSSDSHAGTNDQSASGRGDTATIDQKDVVAISDKEASTDTSTFFDSLINTSPIPTSHVTVGSTSPLREISSNSLTSLAESSSSFTTATSATDATYLLRSGFNSRSISFPSSLSCLQRRGGCEIQPELELQKMQSVQPQQSDHMPRSRYPDPLEHWLSCWCGAPEAVPASQQASTRQPVKVKRRGGTRWWVIGGITFGAVIGGGAVAAIYGVMAYAMKAAVAYSLAWKAATGVAAAEGLCLGGISCRSVRKNKLKADSTQDALAEEMQQHLKQVTTLTNRLKEAETKHDCEVAGLMELNERLTQLVSSLRVENRGLHQALDKAALVAEAHDATTAAAEARNHAAAVAGEIAGLRENQRALLGLMWEVREELNAIKDKDGGLGQGVLAPSLAATVEGVLMSE
eukprot:jgi/Chrzof1/10794/Cz05g12100.t1